MHRIVTGLALAAVLAVTSLGPASAQVYGQYGYQLPPGSYQQSCVNVSMRGSILSASCTSGSGQRIYSSIDVNRCPGANVMNSNGYLTCANGGYNNGYGNGNGYGYGRGHHRHHNDNDNEDDDDDNGNSHNYNGGYSSGYGYGSGYGSLPPGSYQASCINESMNGPVLSAACTNSSGRRVYSSINVNRCASAGLPIRNENGYLRCE